VKLIRATENQFQFQLGKREKLLLLETLKLYPCLPSAHQPLSRSRQLPDQEASQHLLDEALAEQRAEYKKKLLAFLAAPQRFDETSTSCVLKLSPAEMDWLLQILNDIRVGSWVLLGSPEDQIDHLDETTAPHVWAMEMAGFFQMHLLGAWEEEEGEA
jgi:hypothetical protein